jgi:hypothetical protein
MGFPDLQTRLDAFGPRRRIASGTVVCLVDSGRRVHGEALPERDHPIEASLD